MLKTERNSLHDRKEGIPWKDIPKTFQDAMVVTRSLGLRFLWIDSLCIIQDDLDDWALESSKMCHIYANATLTLAASAAEDGAGGLLSDREHVSVPVFRTHDDPTDGLVMVRRDIHRDLSEPGVWMRRGWVNLPNDYRDRLILTFRVVSDDSPSIEL